MKKRNRLLEKLRYFQPREKMSQGWSEVSHKGREWEDIYRQRWQYDKVVRSTHGVNCTGSCSWNIFVKDGIVAWENQSTDYPTTGADMPEFEPRGCPRGASFSWYIYSPLRVKYPYIRSVLLEMWRESLAKTNDPVKAWAAIVENPTHSKRYKTARGKGGLVRTSWEEVTQIIAANLIYTIKKYGPDRILGFSPIPAMSMISYASGSRFLSMLGSPLLSFYDWYADLPPASPQIWGDQTDVPESSDWFNSEYIIVWGSNIPLTRTPDAHFLTEARYKGTKIVNVSPDYAESTKFADNWLSVKPGTDGAVAMAMGHVILNEFYEKNKTDSFATYAKKYTDFPFLVTLQKDGDQFKADRFLNSQDIDRNVQHGDWKTVVFDERTGAYAIPKGTVGSRWDDKQNWNLKMEDEDTNEAIDPRLSILGIEDETVTVKLPYFDDYKKEVMTRSVPVKKIEKDGETIYVTSVYDLMLANYGIDRGIGGDVPQSYDDKKPFTPAWQEEFTGVSRKDVIKIAREFAQNAIDTNGKSMIIVGAGINHWYHSDTIYRAVLNLVLMVGSQGVNGGGWAHYVGQEKLRPKEGWGTLAFAKDWGNVPKQQNGTSFFYFATDQWRYEEIPVSEFVSPVADKARYDHVGDYNVLAARNGWLPSFPQFNKNSIDLYEEAQSAGADNEEQIRNYVAEQLKNKTLQFSIEDPDNPVNFPRTMFVWRANLISSSGKGHEYFLKHLLGTHNGLLNEDSDTLRPEEVKWHDEAPEGKLDLLVDMDFRMSGTALYSDIILPAATWYEKHDLSSTDMHPFVHPFNPAVSPQWESKSDWDTFKKVAKTFSEMSKHYFDGPVKEVIGTPLAHDSKAEISQPLGKVKDWSKGETEPIPGVTMPNIQVVERDYANIYKKMISIGDGPSNNPIMKDEFEKLKKMIPKTEEDGISKGKPSIASDRDAAQMVLSLSSTTNGKVAAKAWEDLEHKTGQTFKDLSAEREAEHFTFDDITRQPKEVLTSPAFSGSNKNRRYSPFTINVERDKPWHTLTGRQHFYIDHEMMMEWGESLATYKPIVNHTPFLPSKSRPDVEGKEITLQYLTPHNKWSIHSMYFDSKPMLELFRGGPTIWLNKDDAAEAGLDDNDWMECFNRNGVVVGRAVVTHRIPRGMAFMHHAQDRHIYVPKTNVSGTRGGTHNSPTKIHVKPTHMIGGYAQLSYGFNYYGPTGNQRDLNVVIRKLKEVDWLED
ncbi:nitrate reductase subunit alpha [Aquibacillus sp. 3ASR75-11]|uniref:nitrate reductase (quinone) n=1 Tax=Terrihalobacillus insolitus TaxID=2950438 RepID=A0A9X4ANZ1_9BACI|nr:nitrate reductase subunit alpha [Terrihalobacillus insolitus]MDC3413511.1 nitrate reductase subunit alpha [Terrihalobacillus insolitus]MDC3426309.1 nitrate reductase subunit alpha [Terrihalobacillus insolitus]